MPTKNVAEFVGPPVGSEAAEEAKRWIPYGVQNVGDASGDGMYLERVGDGIRDFVTGGKVGMEMPVGAPLVPSADADMTYAGIGRKWGLLGGGDSPWHMDLGGGLYLVDINATPNVDTSGVPGLLSGAADAQARARFKDEFPGYLGPAAWPTLTIGRDPVNIDLSYLPAKSLMGVGEDAALMQFRMPFEWNGNF